MLVIEVSLTRVLSVMYYSNYVFLVLSTAMLGLGLGAAAGAWRPGLRRRELLGVWATLASLSAGLLVAATLWMAQPALTLVAAALPYAFTGLALSSIFSLHPAASFRIYWADLLGAGLGTFASLLLVNMLGGSGGLLAGALLLGCAALMLRGTAAALLVTAAALLANASLGWLEPDMSHLPTPKPISEALASGAEIAATRWDAFARNDLVYRPDVDAYYLYIDGAAGSVVPDLNHPAVWQRDIGMLPFLADTPASAFLFGPGGGLDLALAREANTGHLVAAELNGAGIELVRGLAPLTGDVYADVELHVDEGRSVLRQGGELFDLIFLSHVITQTADPRGYSLSEASVYTVEAFADYLEHLTPQGQIALKLYDELTLTRALFTGIEALKQRGSSDAQAARHLFAALDTRTSPPLPLLLVRNQPLTREDAIGLARVAEGLGLGLLFVPGLLANPPLDGLLNGTTSVAEMVAASASNGVQLLPARDSRPFFFHFETGLPRALRPLAIATALLAIVGLAWLLLSLFTPRRADWRAAPLVFAALGAGFMALELSVLQRSQLFLGHPTLALTLVLGTLLIGGGMGSLLGGMLLGKDSRKALVWSSFAVLVLALGWHLSWPWIGGLSQGLPLPARVAIAVLSLLPLTLALGVPFPAALRLLRNRPDSVAGAWALNGVGAVVGSVASVLLAMLVGYGATFLFASTCYLLVYLAALRPWRFLRVGVRQ